MENTGRTLSAPVGTFFRASTNTPYDGPVVVVEIKGLLISTPMI